MEYAERWLAIIKRTTLDRETVKAVSRETVDNLLRHFNARWVEYRKSVTEAGDYAGTEWRGEGIYYYDVFDNQYIDCLGGHGALGLGWSHPEVVAAVRAHRAPLPPTPSSRCPAACDTNGPPLL